LKTELIPLPLLLRREGEKVPLFLRKGFSRRDAFGKGEFPLTKISLINYLSIHN